MKLAYISQPTDLGGSAVQNCGTIYRSEIKETLNNLTKDLHWSENFNKCILGSTGKRDYSGDIDLVIDLLKWDINNIIGFRTMLEDHYGKASVARNGAMIHLRYPIANYQKELKEYLPRTGFVQIDFNFGDATWEKFYHYSSGEYSAYKGAHRNLMLAAICSCIDIIEIRSNAICSVDGFNRPVEEIRWKFSNLGLTKVYRTSQKDRDGNWMRKQVDKVLEGPFLDPKIITEILFPDHNNINNLNNMETIMVAVKENYGMITQERIWKQSASNFSTWKQGKLFMYPPEIAAYFPLNDK